MVLTNYECWANIGGDNNICDITLQQTQLRSQIDLFNPRTLSACRIADKEICEDRGLSPKKVSQISSNGYYGFTYVNNNNNDDVAGNGNDINTKFENHEAKKQHHVIDCNLTTNRSKKISCDKTWVSQAKKRCFIDQGFASNCTTNAKRCRLEDQEIVNSLPFMEPTSGSSMDVDDFEFYKGGNVPYAFPSLRQMSPPRIPSNVKSSSQNSVLINPKFNVFEYNKRCITTLETCPAICTQDFKGSRMYEAKSICEDIPRYKKNKINEMFLERMFSETHGSGVYYLRDMDFDENENVYGT